MIFFNYDFFLLVNWEWHFLATFLPLKQKQNWLLISFNVLPFLSHKEGNTNVSGKCQDAGSQAKTLRQRIGSEVAYLENSEQ